MWFESLWDSQKHMKSYSDAQVNSYKPSYQFNIVIHHYLKFNPFIVQSNYWQSYSLGWTEGILKLKAWRWGEETYRELKTEALAGVTRLDPVYFDSG